MLFVLLAGTIERVVVVSRWDRCSQANALTELSVLVVQISQLLTDPQSLLLEFEGLEPILQSLALLVALVVSWSEGIR